MGRKSRYGDLEVRWSLNPDTSRRRIDLFEELPQAIKEYIFSVVRGGIKQLYYFGYASSNGRRVEHVCAYPLDFVLSEGGREDACEKLPALSKLSGWMRERRGIEIDFPCAYMNEYHVKDILKDYSRVGARILPFFMRFAPQIFGSRECLALFDILFGHLLANKYGRSVFVSVLDEGVELKRACVAMQWAKLPQGIPVSPYIQVGQLDLGERRLYSADLELIK